MGLVAWYIHAFLHHLMADGYLAAAAQLLAGGTLGLTGSFPLHLQAAGKTDLAFLSAVAAPLETSGTVQLDVRVGGTLSAPKTTGFIELDGASLTRLMNDERVTMSAGVP